MPARPLTDKLSVSPQIQLDELSDFAKQGFRTLICNRPDGEGADQPAHQELAEAAAALGLSLHYLPVTPGQLDAASIAGFGKLLAEASGPVLAYCRTGTRSTMLWALSQAGRQPAAQLLQTAQEAGYDLSALAGRLG